ncbi:MAG: hypothetical protein GY717_19175 [Rhodobacteraceae bacterium]|nr:hypothetical protein [Paracoccaceae bacterium]
MRRLLLLAALLAASAANAWTEPQRGTQLRADLMSAIRPHIEWSLGAPVEFVVHDLRVQGDVAFASVWAQRPGGAPINMYATPAVRRNELDPSVGDGPSVQALLQRSGRVWVATHHAISATDVWYSWHEFCPLWHPVVPEVCAN